MSDQTVVVGYLHGHLIPQEFHHSLVTFMHDDQAGPQRVLHFLPQFSGANICRARNDLVTQFLETDGEWLWLLDSDAVFAPWTLEHLLAMADPLERPIVGALAHQYRGVVVNGAPVLGPWGQERECVPTMYRIEWDDDDQWAGYREITRYEPGLHLVDATGAHCLLVHRTVFEAIKSDHPYRWFREDEIRPGTIAGEDIWFCVQARKAGFPIYVDTRLEAGHVKSTVLSSRDSHIERRGF